MRIGSCALVSFSITSLLATAVTIFNYIKHMLFSPMKMRQESQTISKNNSAIIDQTKNSAIVQI